MDQITPLSRDRRVMERVRRPGESRPFALTPDNAPRDGSREPEPEDSAEEPVAAESRTVSPHPGTVGGRIDIVA
jgi:hypothetical protein